MLLELPRTTGITPLEVNDSQPRVGTYTTHHDVPRVLDISSLVMGCSTIAIAEILPPRIARRVAATSTNPLSRAKELVIHLFALRLVPVIRCQHSHIA
jgi:hypothetical protein